MKFLTWKFKFWTKNQTSCRTVPKFKFFRSSKYFRQYIVELIDSKIILKFDFSRLFSNFFFLILNALFQELIHQTDHLKLYVRRRILWALFYDHDQLCSRSTSDHIHAAIKCHEWSQMSHFKLVLRLESFHPVGSIWRIMPFNFKKPTWPRLQVRNIQFQKKAKLTGNKGISKPSQIQENYFNWNKMWHEFLKYLKHN